MKGTGSRSLVQYQKKKKRGRTETETSSGKSIKVAELAVYAAAAGDGTELWVPLIIYQLNNVTLPLEITNHLMLFIVDAGQHLVLDHLTHSVENLRIKLYSTQNMSNSKQGPSTSLIDTLVLRPFFRFNVPSWGSTFESKDIWISDISGICVRCREAVA